VAEPLTIARIAAAAVRGVVDEKSIERKVLVGVAVALVAALFMGTAFAGAFASSVPSFLFGHQKIQLRLRLRSRRTPT